MPTIEHMLRVSELAKQAIERQEKRMKKYEKTSGDPIENSDHIYSAFGGGTRQIGQFHPIIYRAESRGD